MQFGAPLREQLDLQTEAAHLDAFGRNFKHWSGVSFPQVRFAGLLELAARACMHAFTDRRPVGCLLTCSRPRLALSSLRAQPADAPLVSPSVLVETFEQGELIST